MRQGNQDVRVVRDGDNVALAFGFDFCAEHEWGIKGLQSTFGCHHPDVDGVERHLVTGGSSRLRLVEAEVSWTDWSKRKKTARSGARTFLTGGVAAESSVPPRHDHLVTERNADGPVSSWDAEGFCFSMPSDKADVLVQVHAALLVPDAVMFVSAGNPFGGRALVIARASTIPDDIRTTFRDAHVDRRRLEAAALATGIRERVDAWGGGRRGLMGPYHALSPAWNKQGRESAHPVVFWLNPTDQDVNRFGWYTVEELDMWVAGTGPVLDKSPSLRP